MMPLPIAAQNAGPMMNVQLWTATSDLPIAMYCAGSAPAVDAKSWRIVEIDRTQNQWKIAVSAKNTTAPRTSA